MEFWCIDVVGRKLILVTLKTWEVKDIICYYFIIYSVACEQALLFGQAKRAMRERVKLARREQASERPRKRALLSLVCLQAIYNAPFVYK